MFDKFFWSDIALVFNIIFGILLYFFFKKKYNKDYKSLKFVIIYSIHLLLLYYYFENYISFLSLFIYFELFFIALYLFKAINKYVLLCLFVLINWYLIYGYINKDVYSETVEGTYLVWILIGEIGGIISTVYLISLSFYQIIYKKYIKNFIKVKIK